MNKSFSRNIVSLAFIISLSSIHILYAPIKKGTSSANIESVWSSEIKATEYLNGCIERAFEDDSEKIGPLAFVLKTLLEDKEGPLATSKKSYPSPYAKAKEKTTVNYKPLKPIINEELKEALKNFAQFYSEQGNSIEQTWSEVMKLEDKNPIKKLTIGIAVLLDICRCLFKDTGLQTLFTSYIQDMPGTFTQKTFLEDDDEITITTPNYGSLPSKYVTYVKKYVLPLAKQ